MEQRISGGVQQDWPADGVLRLTISNPAKRNALDHEILNAIAAAVSASQARCVILTGSHGMFSAGYDIRDIPEETFSADAEKLVAHPFSSAIEALEAVDIPTIAACGGHAIGGGLELALACDFRVAGATIKLAMTPAKLGLVYSHTGLRRFIDVVGVARTRELFLLGTELDAETARDWGLVTRVCPTERVQDTALELANILTTMAPLSLAGNKRIIRSMLAAEWELAAELEAELIEIRRASFHSQDLREGLRAFSERRPARWLGT